MLGTIEFLHGLEQGSEYEAEIEAGKRLLLGISSIGDADRHGMRTVMCTLNGQFRPIQVRDRSVTADVKAVEKADPTTKPATCPRRSPAWSPRRSPRATPSRPAASSPPSRR